MRFLLTLLIALVLTGACFAGQTLEHVVVSGLIYDQLHGSLPFEEVTMPLALIGGHIALDHFEGENAVGPDLSGQVLYGGLFFIVGRMMIPEGSKQQKKYDYCTLWGAIIPDTILKFLVHHNDNYGRWIPEENHVIEFSSQQQLYLTGIDLISVKYVF